MFARLLQWFLPRPPAPAVPPSAEAQALALIAAIDRGGIPLNVARVNHIARELGLEVSAKAPVEETIARIRAACQRIVPPGN
jgi:hypothetical protein